MWLRVCFISINKGNELIHCAYMLSFFDEPYTGKNGQPFPHAGLKRKSLNVLFKGLEVRWTCRYPTMSFNLSSGGAVLEMQRNERISLRRFVRRFTWVSSRNHPKCKYLSKFWWYPARFIVTFINRPRVTLVTNEMGKLTPCQTLLRAPDSEHCEVTRHGPKKTEVAI